MNEPDKHWKFDRADLEKRKQWDDYQLAFQDMLNECTTEYAPWHVIPADQKWYRNLAIMRTIVSAMKQMDIKYPVSDYLSDIVVD